MKSLFIAAAILAGLLAAPAQAAGPAQLSQVAACRGGIESVLGFRSWDACLPLNPQNGKPHVSGLKDIWLIVLVVVEDVLKAAGYMAVGFIVWGGIKYLKSQGEPGEITQARQIIFNALFGLVLTMIAIPIITFIAGGFNAS